VPGRDDNRRITAKCKGKSANDGNVWSNAQANAEEIKTDAGQIEKVQRLG
jgi:hypothetical protein